MRIKVFLFYAFLLSNTIFAAEWQWSVEIKSIISGETNSHPRAYLWIPENCKQVRGVVVGMHNLQEEGILEHKDFRKAMRTIGFAEIWITPGMDPLFDPEGDSLVPFDEALNTLSEISGYSELRYAPVVPIGHSAYASYPWNFAAWNPRRTLAILSIHGDAPQTNLTGCGRKNLDWESRNTNGIPGLMVMGEYEWWDDRLLPAIEYKNNNPQAPVSLLADAGYGHFDHSDALVSYLAEFVKKAAYYRLPEKMPLNRLTELKPVFPENGWLADRWYADQSLPKAEAASFQSYKGDRKTAFWYFDKEIARMTEIYYAKARGKKRQYIGFMQDGKLLPFNKGLNAYNNIAFKPGKDGLAFSFVPVFTDSLYTRLSNDHSNIKKIRTEKLTGPFKLINDTTFTVCFNRIGLNNHKRTGAIWIVACHEGDDEYKSAVQQLNMQIPYPQKEGKKQMITFEFLKNINTKVKTVELKAQTDSGLPVNFYVQDGPARIEDGKLVLTKLPPRAKFPVKVTVVAWQYGCNADEKIQTAEAVERSFYIER